MAGLRVLRVLWVVTGWALVSACGQTNHNASGGAGSTAAASSGVGGSASSDAPSTANGGAGMETNAQGGNAPNGAAPGVGTNAGGDGTVVNNAGTSAGGSDSGGLGHGGQGGQASDVTRVWKSDACGKPTTLVSGAASSIATKGSKDADCGDKLQDGTRVCGPWMLDREYRVYLPANYEPGTPYQLLFQAPGCGGQASLVYDLSKALPNVIRVGLTPPPISIGHATNPGQGCFDDKEGDDSVDFTFYETLYDKLNAELCFDRNRVYASGYSSGAWLANELGCKYAGDAHGRPVRGVLPSHGGLPTQAAFTPRCTQAPMAGIWVAAQADDLPDASWRFPVSRALQVNGCTARDYNTATLQDFPIGGANAPTTCKKVVECPTQHPLVVCTSTTHQTDDATIAIPAFATFLNSLAAP